MFILLFIVSCATTQQQIQATEGIYFETGKTRDEVMDALVQVLTEEGFAIDIINEKFGIINTKPLTILTGALMTKLGELGGSFVGTNQNITHKIDFTANITKQGRLRIKTTARQVKDENIMDTIMLNKNARRSESIDIIRTNKLNEYYLKKIKERLQI